MKRQQRLSIALLCPIEDYYRENVSYLTLSMIATEVDSLHGGAIITTNSSIS